MSLIVHMATLATSIAGRAPLPRHLPFGQCHSLAGAQILACLVKNLFPDLRVVGEFIEHLVANVNRLDVPAISNCGTDANAAVMRSVHLQQLGSKQRRGGDEGR